MLSPRRGGGSHRFLPLRIAIFFLAAGIWLAGVLTGRDEVTGIALGILVLGWILTLVARRSAEEEPEE